MNHLATKAHLKKQLKIRSQISYYPLIFGILTILIDIMNLVE